MGNPNSPNEPVKVSIPGPAPDDTSLVVDVSGALRGDRRGPADTELYPAPDFGAPSKPEARTMQFFSYSPASAAPAAPAEPTLSTTPLPYDRGNIRKRGNLSGLLRGFGLLAAVVGGGALVWDDFQGKTRARVEEILEGSKPITSTPAVAGCVETFHGTICADRQCVSVDLNGSDFTGKAGEGLLEGIRLRTEQVQSIITKLEAGRCK